MENNKVLKKLLSSASQLCKQTLAADIKHNEAKIAVLQGEKCKELIKNATKGFSTDGNFNQNTVWKMKKNCFLKSQMPHSQYTTVMTIWSLALEIYYLS